MVDTGYAKIAADGCAVLFWYSQVSVLFVGRRTPLLAVADRGVCDYMNMHAKVG